MNQLLTTGRWLGIGSALSLSCLGFAQSRPTTVKLLPGTVEIRNVTYSSDTPTDITKAAAGSGDLAVSIRGLTYTKPGVTFTGLLFDSAGTLIGVHFNLDRPFEMTPAPGVKLTIPQGAADIFADKQFTCTGKATLSTPYRSRNGDSIELEASKFSISGSESEGSLGFNGLSLRGAAISEGIQLPGLKITSSAWNFKLDWKGQAPATWQLTVPSGTVEAGLPGVPTTPQYPLAVAATNLTLDQDGKVNCPEFSISNRSTINFPDIAGFQATVKGGKLTVRNSKPSISDLRVDVTLPPALQSDDEPSNGNPPSGPNAPRRPVRMPDAPNVIVRVENGVTIEFPDPVKFKVGQTKITARKIFIDLSTSLFGAGAPAVAADPKWKGIWLPSGTVVPPLGPDGPQLAYTNFLVEPNGLSGSAVASNLTYKADSYTVEQGEVGLTFAQNQLTAGYAKGNVNLPNLGKLPCEGEFSENGDFRLAVNEGTLDFSGLGLKLSEINAQFDSNGLVLGGALRVKPEFFTQHPGIPAPDSLKGAKFEIQGLKVAPDGAITLPTNGGVTLGNPVRLELGPAVAEIRGVYFTTTNNSLDSVTFTGSAGLKKPIEGLPAAGELDFEGMKISRRPGDPPFSMGGFGFRAEIPQVGTISASLYRKTIDSFGETLYGDAELRLNCLGSMASGIGLEFLVAPKGDGEPAAWFIGGSVETPPILVQAPATPPVPLFNINGFSGGIGLNVLPREAGVGRITEPDQELKYSKGAFLAQVGLLMSDPASAGRVWWADTALTLTFNPVIADLTARMVFLDPEGARFLDESDWRLKDRIARAYMTFDSRRPAFVIGADADLTFPTRSTQIFAVSGAAELLISPNDRHLYIGWVDGGQKPIHVQFADAFKEVMSIDATFGMGLDFGSNGRPGVSGGFFLDADASLKVGEVGIEGGLYADLRFAGLGTANLTANGTARLDALADFGFFTAQVEANLSVVLAKDLRLEGEVAASAGPFSGSVPVLLVIKK